MLDSVSPIPDTISLKIARNIINKPAIIANGYENNNCKIQSKGYFPDCELYDIEKLFFNFRDTIITYFQYLTRLSFNNNGIDSLEQLSKFTKLKVLSVNNNNLKNLKGLEKFSSIEIFHCSGNQLQDLSGIENMNTLKELYCYDNPITTLNCKFPKNIKKIVISKSNKNILEELKKSVNINIFIETSNTIYIDVKGRKE